MNRENFDSVIGRLDRILSEFLCLYEPALDEPDRQTLKHHADDLIGVGGKMRQILGDEMEKSCASSTDSARAEFLANNPPWS